MPLVRIEPLGATFDVTPEETMLVAAWRLGYPWPSRCWGQAECMVCHPRSPQKALHPALRQRTPASAIRRSTLGIGPHVRG